MLMKINRLTKQGGVTLLELMLVIAIIVVILVFATRYYIVTERAAKVNQTVTLINAITGGVANWRVGKYGYQGLNWAALNTIGALAKADYDGKDVRDTWGHKVTLDPSAATVLVEFQKVPSQSCESLVQKLATLNAKCEGTNFTYTIGPTTESATTD